MGEHAAVYGRPALVTAIDLRLRVEVLVRPGEQVRIESPMLGRSQIIGWPTILQETRRARETWWRWAKTPETERYTPEEGVGLVKLALGEAADHVGVEQPPGLTVWIERRRSSRSSAR